MTLTEDGMVIDDSDVHSSKHISLISLTDDGIMIDEIDEHSMKYLFYQ